MDAALLSRRSIALGLVCAAVQARAAEGGAAAEGLSRSCACIHQEREFAASPAAVYGALTDSGRFDALTRLSDAASLLAAAGARATAISPQVGGAFVLFGGYITGRHLEMVPGRRLVQAWRAGGWDAGEYSVVRFALAASAGGCRLTFDQRGFPDSQGTSLAYGWRVHYWEPLAKLLQPHT